MQGNISFVIHANGNLKVYSIVTALVTLLVIPFGYFFLKKGAGPNSVFWVSLALTVLNYIISTLILYRIVPFSSLGYIRRVLLPLLLMSLTTIPFPLMIIFYLEDGWLRFIVVTLVSVLFTALSAYLVALNKEERLFVSDIVKSKVARVFSRNRR